MSISHDLNWKGTQGTSAITLHLEPSWHPTCATLTSSPFAACDFMVTCVLIFSAIAFSSVPAPQITVPARLAQSHEGFKRSYIAYASKIITDKVGIKWTGFS